MLNKIISYSLQNRLFVVVTAALLAAAGCYIASRMEVDVFPDLNAPTVVVMTEAQGMATEDVERLVTFPVETALNGASGVRRVRSASSTGFSVIWIEFDWNTDIYIARQIVSEKLSAIGDQLPAGVGQPTLGPQSSILGEMMIVGLTADSTSLEDLRTLADRTMRPRLLATGGVAQVAVIGGEIKEYQVLLSTRRMKQLGVSLDEVMAATRDMNRNSSGGVLYEYGNEYIVRGVVSVADVEALALSVIKMDGGRPVTLGDVAEIRAGSRSPRLGAASVEGHSGVLITITKQPGAGTIDLTGRIDRVLEELDRDLPQDVKVSTNIFRQSDFIDASIRNIRQALFEGGIFVVLILALFLMNGRVTVISLTALPLSLLMSVMVLELLGMTINTMSLGGMAIAIGSLVDDAIIDVENVLKRLKENHRRPPGKRDNVLNVIYDASREIRSSIVQATMITIVAFIPLFFLSGMEGRMLRPLGVAFIVSLFSSLIVAVTLTPVMCSYMVTGEKQLAGRAREPWLSRVLGNYYRRALAWVLRRPRVVIMSALALFAGAIAVFATLGSNFLPPFNEGSLTVGVATMPGISLDESDNIGRSVERILMEVPEITTVARKTGRAELDEHALGVNASELEAPFTLDERSREEFLADVRERLSVLGGVAVEVGQPISHRIDAMLSGTKANIAIKLFGTDLRRMYSLGQQIRSAVADVEGLADLNLEQLVESPQLQIVPRREVMARYGITMPEFMEFIEIALGGEPVSQVYDGTTPFDLVVKAADAERNSAEEMGNLLIDTGTGVKVPLGEVARIVSTAGPNAVNHENIKRKIVVSANVTGGDLSGAVKQIRERIESKVTLPEGYHIEYGGQFESQQAASRTLSLVSVAALLVIFMLLFQEFRNARLSSMVMLGLPLAMVGGVAAIWITSGIISIPATIGFISLLGIAVRNGILLVSRYEHLRCDGLSAAACVVRGSADRLNPIMMTSLTSALALIPLAVNGDVAGNEIQSPMAVVILGGLISSTLLNVFVLPSVYLVISTRKRRRKGTKHEK